MTAIIQAETKTVARPLPVLVPLIKKDLADAKEATERVGMPYYRAAGEKMTEAKAQMKHGEFGPWIKRNFGISQSHAEFYMKLAGATGDKQNQAAVSFSSLKDFRRRHLGHDIPTSGGGLRQQAWHEPVKQIIGKVDLDTLNRREAEIARRDERDAERTLALQLIAIGYKALATKLHPDAGGSRAAMARLNRVRDRLKQAV